MPDAIASDDAHASRPRSRVVDAIVWAGATAGVLDILCAIGLTMAYGGSPIRMLQGIASGVLGRASFEGGLPTAGLGLLLHFFIATTAATVYVLASRKLPALIERAVPYGAAYGVAVYFFMQLVVLPITFRRPPTFAWISTTQMLIIHIVAVGLPIALMARKALLGPR